MSLNQELPSLQAAIAVNAVGNSVGVKRAPYDDKDEEYVLVAIMRQYLNASHHRFDVLLYPSHSILHNVILIN